MSRAAVLRALAIATALGLARVAAAQTAPWAGLDARQAAVVELGLEPELVLSFGYLRSLPRAGGGPRLAAGLGLKVAPLALARHGAWRTNVLLAGDWRTPRGFGVGATAATYLVHDENDAGEQYGLGVELRAAPGYQGGRWQAGLDLGWQGTLLTHVRHSALSRRTFEDRYPPGVEGEAGPVDGWYRSTAHRFRLGVRGGWEVSERVALSLALGSLVSYQRQGILFAFDLAQIPLYLETGVRVGW